MKTDLTDKLELIEHLKTCLESMMYYKRQVQNSTGSINGFAKMVSPSLINRFKKQRERYHRAYQLFEYEFESSKKEL